MCCVWPPSEQLGDKIIFRDPFQHKLVCGSRALSRFLLSWSLQACALELSCRSGSLNWPLRSLLPFIGTLELMSSLMTKIQMWVLNSTEIARSSFFLKITSCFLNLLVIEKIIIYLFFQLPKNPRWICEYCKAFKHMPSLMITDLIGETKALVSHPIFRQKSEVWHTIFFSGIFCALLVFTVPVICCM